jgi:hypothetical protein
VRMKRLLTILCAAFAVASAMGLHSPSRAAAANWNWWPSGYASTGWHQTPHSSAYDWQTFYINAGTWNNYLDSCWYIDYQSGQTGISPNNMVQQGEQYDTRVRFYNYNGTSTISAWTAQQAIHVPCGA